MSGSDLSPTSSQSLSDHAGQWNRQRGAIRPVPAYVEQFMGIVRATPCSTGEANDYGDARYYIDRATATLAKGQITAVKEQVPGIGQCLTATNLAEAAAGTHLLAEGTVVQVFAFVVRGVPDQKVYVFNCQPATAVVVKITASAAGAGEYDGRILSGLASATGSGSLAMPSGMTIPTSDNALVLNSEEDSLSGNRLLIGSYATGVVVGQTAEETPRRIVVVRGALGATSGASAVGSASDASESADSTAWSRATSGTPVNVTLVSRVVYNAAGDQTLYQFTRQLSFDARGQLVSVSGETRETVDATEACS